MKLRFSIYTMFIWYIHLGIVKLGMFGVKLYQKRDLVRNLTKSVLIPGQNHYVLQDQFVLYDYFWPIAKYDVVTSFFFFLSN